MKMIMVSDEEEKAVKAMRRKKKSRRRKPAPPKPKGPSLAQTVLYNALAIVIILMFLYMILGAA